MRMSPASRLGRMLAMVWSTTADGTMSHTARGLAIFSTRSSREDEDVAFSAASPSTDLGKTSKTTQSCPLRIKRRTILAPILPRPTIPSCIVLSLAFSRLTASAATRTVLAVLQLAVVANHVVGGAVVLQRRLLFTLEFGDDTLRQNLAEFHAPLIKRVDAPDDALGEKAVLVEGDEAAQHLRRQLLGKDDVRRAVAVKDAMGHQPFRRALGLHLLGSFAESQRLGLGAHVGNQQVVVTT